MNEDNNETACRGGRPARQDGLDARARIAELEAEVAMLRRALAPTGITAERDADQPAGEPARERGGRAVTEAIEPPSGVADAAETPSAAVAEAEARHGRERQAGRRADLTAEQADNEVLHRANAALAASRATLREHEERLRLILDSAADYAIFTTGPDRRVASWNAGAERLLGWSEAEIVGRSWDLIFTPEDRAAGVPEREAAEALAEGGPRTSAGTSARTAPGSGRAG